MGVFDGFALPKQRSNPHPKLNMKHYKTLMFVQISESQAPLHKCKAPLAYRRLSGDGSVATPSFLIANSLVTIVRF